MDVLRTTRQPPSSRSPSSVRDRGPSPSGKGDLLSSPAASHDDDAPAALLDRLLRTLDTRVDLLAVCEVSRGWRLTFEPEREASVHYGLAGAGVLHLAHGPPVSLAPDTFVVLPPRVAHGIEPSGDGAREVKERRGAVVTVDGLPRVQAGTAEIGLAAVCGRIRMTYGEGLDLFQYLDHPIVESFADTRSVRNTFRTMLAELAAPTVGTRALTEILLKQSLILLLRRRLRGSDVRVPWLTALKDPRLARVLLAMLERPGEPFTLESLALLAGMSRSAFADRFAAAFGRGPIEFLRNVRLRRAARLLETTGLPVKAVAGSVGYTSRSYFSRAFSALHGVDPTAYRGSGSRD